MKLPSFFGLLLAGNILAPALALQSRQSIPLFSRDGTDDQVLTYFREVGQCFLYLESVDDSTLAEKQVGPCKTYCTNLDESTSKYSCNGYDGISSVSDVSDESLIQYDDDGNVWIPSTCNCEDSDDGSNPTATKTGNASSTTTGSEATETGDDDETCYLCGSSAAKRSAMKKRWGEMFIRQSDDAETCAIAPDEEASFVEVRHVMVVDFSDASDSHLDKRVDKALTLELGGPVATLVFGDYPQGVQATSVPQIDKYFWMTDRRCSGLIERRDLNELTQAEINGELETDHVYEAQTARDWFKWLGSNAGQTIGSTNMPTASWVMDTLLDADGGNAFPLVKPGRGAGGLGTPAGGDTLDEVMFNGFGRVDGFNTRGKGLTKARTVVNLAVLQGEANLKKGVWFGQNRPCGVDYPSQNQLVTNKHCVASAAATFHYIGWEGDSSKSLEPIWNKWMRVSNWFDLVLYEFDQAYTWGDANNNAGEPTRTDGADPSLRSLYAYWIDLQLQEIEARASTYSTEAQTELETNHQFNAAEQNLLSAANRRWFAAAFGDDGWATVDALTFPRPDVPNGASVYGAWGYPEYTLDGSGAQRDIGFPSAP